MATMRAGDGSASVIEAASEEVATTGSTSAAPRLKPESRTGGWGLPLAVLIIGTFMSILDMSIVNVAVPAIKKDFGVSTESIQWISTAYSLTEGVVVPASAWLGAQIGLKRLYLWSLAWFTVFSAMCGMAGDLGPLVFFRILQAVPGGLIPVTCLTLLYRMVPREKLGAAMGLYGLGVIVAPAIGPTLGGYFVEYVDWRLIFYVNVPIGVAGVLAAIVVLAKFPSEPNRPFDIVGFVCIAGGLSALLLALEEGSDWGWTSYPVLILFAASLNLLALFVIVELHVDHPLLDVRVFTHWPFVNSILLISTMSVGLFAVVFYVPVFLQNVQGLTPSNTGLVLMPQALALALVMPISGQLYDRFGARWPAYFGMLLTGTGILLLAGINVDTSRGELIWALVIMGAGLGLGMMPIMTGGLASLPSDIADSGSAFSTLAQRVSAALGLAALTALITVQRAQLMADRSGLIQGSGANADPWVLSMQKQGPTGLIPMWQQLSLEVQTQAYSNAFLAAGSATLLGAALAFLLPPGPPPRDAEKPMVH